MSDCVRRESVKEWLKRWDGYIDKDIIARMQDRVVDIPSADVTEVVRCKDCIYSHTDIYYGEECLTCENADGLCCDVYKEDYCSMGERRTDDG